MTSQEITIQAGKHQLSGRWSPINSVSRKRPLIVVGNGLGCVCPGLNPLPLGHRLVGDDVNADIAFDALHVSPFSWASVFEPEATGSNVTCQSLAIQAFDDSFIARIAPSF